jgi:hypothetical protein
MQLKYRGTNTLTALQDTTNPRGGGLEYLHRSPCES